MNGSLLEVKHLQKLFEGRGSSWSRSNPTIHALEDVSLEVSANEIVGLVGESGSGKSTLGRSILRLIEPTAGQITFNGSDITRLSQRSLGTYRRDMQMIFQDPFASLNPRMKVGEILAEPLRIHGGVAARERSQRVAALLERVGLAPEYMSRYPHQFSGGQRQRLGIARALILNPRFVVADEPVSALDVSVQAQVINLIRDLQEEAALAILFISHDLSVVEYLCHRVVVLYLGRVMEIASSAQLYNAPKHPYTEALLSAAPALHANKRRDRIFLRNEIPSAANPPSGCVFRTRCPYAIPECSEVVPGLRQVDTGHWKACVRDVL